jgi:hypothetical protein
MQDSFMVVAKGDAGQFVIYGPANDLMVDKQGEEFTEDCFREALAFHLDRGFISLAHKDIRVGKPLALYKAPDGREYRSEVRVVTEQDAREFPESGLKVGQVAPFLVSSIDGDTEFGKATRDLALSKRLRAYSVAGKAVEQARVVKAGGFPVNQIRKFEWHATTLCPSGVSEGAAFRIVAKADQVDPADVAFLLKEYLGKAEDPTSTPQETNKMPEQPTAAPAATQKQEKGPAEPAAVPLDARVTALEKGQEAIQATLGQVAKSVETTAKLVEGFAQKQAPAEGAKEHSAENCPDPEKCPEHKAKAKAPAGGAPAPVQKATEKSETPAPVQKAATETGPAGLPMGGNSGSFAGLINGLLQKAHGHGNPNQHGEIDGLVLKSRTGHAPVGLVQKGGA